MEDKRFKLIGLIVFVRLDESVFHHTIEKLKQYEKQFSNKPIREFYYQRDEYYGG